MVKSTSELKMPYVDLLSSYVLVMWIGIILHVIENKKFTEIHAWGEGEQQFSWSACSIMNLNGWNTILKGKETIK